MVKGGSSNASSPTGGHFSTYAPQNISIGITPDELSEILSSANGDAPLSLVIPIIGLGIIFIAVYILVR